MSIQQPKLRRKSLRSKTLHFLRSDWPYLVIIGSQLGLVFATVFYILPLLGRLIMQQW